MSNRVTLTKAERQSAAGAELISICSSLTDDGHLDHLELRALDKWLTANRNSDLPAIRFLTAILDKVMADGRVTPDELTDVHRAIERILPADLRQNAISKRREKELALVREMEDRAAAGAHRQAEYAAAQAAMAQSGEIAAVDIAFSVAGITHKDRHMLIVAHARRGQQVFLIRERQNAYSRNAIEVRLPNGIQIGYVPDTLATEWARYLDSGYLHLAYIERFIEWPSNGMMCPRIEGGLYVPNSNFPGAVRESAVPGQTTPPPVVRQPLPRPERPPAATPTNPYATLALAGAAAFGAVMLFGYLLSR